VKLTLCPNKGQNLPWHKLLSDYVRKFFFPNDAWYKLILIQAAERENNSDLGSICLSYCQDSYLSSQHLSFSNIR